MTDLRKAARGQPCALRLPGCLPGSDTVVLAHLRRGNIAGVGQKPCDLAGIPMCDACHGKYDRRVPSSYSREAMDAECLRALCQWLSFITKQGWVK